MVMTHIKENNPVFDHSFSVFALGLTLGIVGAMLLGTEEGRKVSQEILDAVSKSKLKEDLIDKSKSAAENVVDKIEDAITGIVPNPHSFPPLPHRPLSEPQYFKR